MTSGLISIIHRNFHRTTKFLAPTCQRAYAGHYIQQRSSSTSQPPFRRVLIANRGEIALRVMRTARQQNIDTVAIYSTADAKSLHVAMADEAVCIGGAASSDSYLDIDKVCEAIELTGAECVHPGYGFLSENAAFCERVEQMNVNESVYGGAPTGKKVKFVGPSQHAIHSLGDKIQSKLIADAAGVSTIPGYNGVVTSPKHAIEIAHSIGYPVMIKASSGGGGKGMRICYTDAQVEEGYRLGSAEAKSFFGGKTCRLPSPQNHPNSPDKSHFPASGMYALNQMIDSWLKNTLKRECSIQRRNQKVLEESPSPHLLPETRREMIRQVKSLVREVEHPVTEMTSGDGYASGCYVDLVHGMLEVAAGRGIPQKYLDMVDHSKDDEYGDGGEGANVRFTGHAIEARVYAEDPLRGFLPSTGPLIKYSEPPGLLHIGDTDEPCNIRIDTGVVPGTIISPFYDPIISKIISYSPAGRTNSIQGVQHNVPFCRDVLRNDDFVRGHTPTSFIEHHYPDGFSGGKLSEVERKQLVAIAREIAKKRSIVMGSPPLALSGKDGDEPVVVCLGGMFGDAYLVESKIDLERDCIVTASVSKLKNEPDDANESLIVELCNLNYEPSNDLAHISLSGEERALQASHFRKHQSAHTSI
eukprot:scaffold111374_cov76-Cyclotella_meneghiniana.AAC.2